MQELKYLTVLLVWVFLSSLNRTMQELKSRSEATQTLTGCSLNRTMQELNSYKTFQVSKIWKV